MVEIGQLLRQTREAKELSLADVEDQTRIRQRYLNALESGDWDDLPNQVAARGFLRTYATFLGLDAEELVAQSQDKMENAATLTAQTPLTDYKPINLDIYDDIKHRSHLLRRVLGFIIALIPVLILAYLLFYYGLPYLRENAAGNESVIATVALPPAGQAPDAPVIGVTASPTAQPTLAAGALPSTFTPTPAPTNTPTIAPSASLTPSPTEAIRLRVVVTNTAWVRVVTDDVVQVESLQDPGYDQEFVAHRQMEFLTGNAGGVKLILNGKPLPPLGDIGQVIIFIWTTKDGQVIEITPTPTLSPTPTPKKTPGATSSATPGG